MKRESPDKRPASELLWFVVQMLGLMAAFLAPFLSDEKEVAISSSTVSEGFSLLKENYEPEYRPVARVQIKTKRVSVDTMTSEIVNLPNPDFAQKAVVKISAKHRQIRFQKNMHKIKARSPASAQLPSTFQWQLSKVMRKVGKSFQEVQLISGGDMAAISTVYLELSDGTNEFQVVYRDPKGHEKSMTVQVEHPKKNNS